jgi:hypothetical protein
MNLTFGNCAVLVMAIFLLGAGYGAMWNQCVTSASTFTKPTTTEELATMRASLSRSSTSPAPQQLLTNAIDEPQP